MQHEAHVRAIYAHAEGVGGDDERQVAGEKSVLGASPHHRVRAA